MSRPSGAIGGACGLLIAEQDRVRALFGRFDAAAGARRRKAAGDAALDAAEVLLALEEQLLCPAVRDVLGARRGTAGILEGARAARPLIRELRASPAGEAYEARLARLREHLLRRFDGERAGLFPGLAGSALDLDRLGGEMIEFKTALERARPGGASRRLRAAFAALLG